MNKTTESPAVSGVGSTDLLCRIDSIFKEAKRPLSAADVARELNRRGWMPETWSTLDVADFLRDWYGSGPPRD